MRLSLYTLLYAVVWSPEQSMAASGCEIEIVSCPLHPNYLGRVSDSYDGSDQNPNRCMQRARDYSLWCDSEEDITAHFFSNGSKIDSRTYRSNPHYDSTVGYVEDLHVRISPCTNNSATTCAFLTPVGAPPIQVWIANEIFKVKEFGSIGRQFSSSLPGVYFYLYRDDLKVTVRVVDPGKGRQVAWTNPPDDYNLFYTYFSKVNGPGKTAFPFLAPGQRYLTKPHWNFLCQFDVAAIDSPDLACGTGFRMVNVDFVNSLGQSAKTASGFRHNGGWVDDLNGDGYDEINLPYLSYILSIDGRSGQRVALSHFDVASRSKPNAPAFFHSGRFYGGFTSFTHPENGSKMTLITAGNAVGSFDDHFCGVSRYVAGVNWIDTGYLQWSNYLSFQKTLFSPPYNSFTNIRYKGDAMNLCLHRFSNSLFSVEGYPAAAYSYFKADPSNGNCEVETLIEQASGFNESAISAFNNCALQRYLPTRGIWTVQFLDAVTGDGVIAWPGAYLWGRVERFAPDQPFHFIVETFESKKNLRFDQLGHVPDRFFFSAIPKKNWNFSHSGSLARPGARPSVRLKYGYYGSYPRGVGQTFNGVPELVVRDIDGDGFNDFQLENGEWVGYSTLKKTFITKQM